MKKFLPFYVLIFMSITKIYSQNLALNGDFSGGNTDFVSDYVNAASNTTPGSPLYGVVSNPSSWDASYPTCGDHTGSFGNMLVLNSANLNNTVWKQTIAVTAGKNYQFSYWVQSLQATSPAALQVVINGVNAGTVSNAPATTACGNWLRVVVNWSSAASTSAVVEIKHNVGTLGNAFAIDDIVFTALPTATITGTNSVCNNSVGNFVTFTGADGIAPYTFIYNVNGGTNQSITTTLGNSITLPVPTNTVGTFNYNLISVAYGTTPVFTQNQTGTATITVLPLPTASISGSAYVCSGASGNVTFTGTPNATVNYTINNGAPQSVVLDAAGNAVVNSGPITASATYELVTVVSSGTPTCSQSITGSAVLSVPTSTIFGNTTISPGESAVITFFGTPGVTVNFTSVLGPASVVLNASGVGYYNIPYIDTTTVFSLVDATVGSCVTPLTGSVTITVRSICDIASTGDLPLAEVSIVAPQAVCNLGDCTDLLAEYTKIASTDDGNAVTADYAVCQIPYAPTFPFTGGTVINATGDDSWSNIVTLPFDFSFYGNCYNNVLVGTNGVITFDLIGQTPLGGCAWQYNQTIPNAGFPIKNAIYGVYQDTNIAAPPVTNVALQNVNYYILDTGVNAEPNRVFVANFNELPQFQCNNSVGFQTSQIVIHEATNIIEVLVSRRTSCTTWNNGSGLIGIQNAAGNIALPAPGRNTGTWNTTNEAWRFSPIGRPSAITTELSWEEDGNPIPGSLNQNPITVCPTSTHTYSAVVTYKKCNGTSVEVRDDVTVGVATPLPVADPQNITFCSSALPPYTVDINQNAAMLSTVPVADQGNYSITYYERFDDAKNAAPTNIDFTSVADLSTYQVTTLPKTIYVRIEDLVTTGCFNVRPFVIDVVSSPSGTFAYPGSPLCNNDAVPIAPTLYSLTSGGTFSASSPNLSINPTTGAINGAASLVGNYIVSYDIPATALCPALHEEATVEIIACSCTVTASSSLEKVCVGSLMNSITYTSTPAAISGSVNPTDLPAGVTASFSGGTLTISGTPTASGVFTFPVTMFSGPTDSCTTTTTIEVSALPTATLSSGTTICSGTSTTLTITGTAGATVTYNVGSGPNTTTTLDAAGNGTINTGNLTAATTYNLISIDSNGTPNCSQTLTGSSTINITNLPTVAISGTATICSGDTATITFTGTPNATVTYLINNTGSAQSITLDGAGTASFTTLPLT
ncbi:hypothetical protein G4D82_07180, partial [Flavobacterium sp. CYK-4]|nr:hypothetical protein [Flavobacterium lotistagni]